MEFVKVQKHGGSKSVSLPHRYCKKLGIELGHFLACSISIDGAITLKPTKDQKDPTCHPDKS